MRAIFGVLGLVIVLGTVGWLARTQLASSRHTLPSTAMPGVEPVNAPAVTARDQSQQMQHQIKQSVEAAMQQARPMPDDK